MRFYESDFLNAAMPLLYIPSLSIRFSCIVIQVYKPIPPYERVGYNSQIECHKVELVLGCMLVT